MPTVVIAYSQGYTSSRYPSAATPPQPAVVSGQTYSMYGTNKAYGNNHTSNINIKVIV